MVDSFLPYCEKIFIFRRFLIVNPSGIIYNNLVMESYNHIGG